VPDILYYLALRSTKSQAGKLSGGLLVPNAKLLHPKDIAEELLKVAIVVVLRSVSLHYLKEMEKICI
jgi:hypothetical protein